MSLKICTGLKEIAPSYEYFLIDLWGGSQWRAPIPGYVLEQHLKDIGPTLVEGNRVYSSGNACLGIFC